MTRVVVDFRYVEIDHELWSLGHMLRVLGSVVDTVSAEDERQTVGQLRRHGWDTDEAEVDLAMQDVREKRERVLLRFMRGPFVVALWACFESSVTLIARTRASEIGAPIALNELRGSFDERAGRYFTAILGLALDTDEARRARLAELSLVRNAFAHANGLREGMPPSKWQSLSDRLGQRGLIDDDRGVVVLSHDYIERAYADVAGCLGDLVRRARTDRPSRPASNRPTHI